MVIKSSNEANLLLLKIVLIVFCVLLLTACDASEVPTQCPDVDCPEVVMPEPVLYEELWEISGHADDTSEAFNHWNEEEPPEIPVACAKCHSRPGFIAFVGADGSDPGVVENPAPHPLEAPR